MTEYYIKSRNWSFSCTFGHTSLDFDAKTKGMKFTVLWVHWGIHATLCVHPSDSTLTYYVKLQGHYFIWNLSLIMSF